MVKVIVKLASDWDYRKEYNIMLTGLVAFMAKLQKKHESSLIVNMSDLESENTIKITVYDDYIE